MKNAAGRTLYPYKFALKIGERLVELLTPVTERIEIVGSVRRRRKMVHDVEILFIPRLEDSKEDMFEKVMRDKAEELINKLVEDGKLSQRHNSSGHPTWGKLNKLAREVKSDFPIDFFATTQLNWWNALVTRTGGKETNLLISKTALDKGWSFEAGGSGYHKTNDSNERHDCDSEKDVFKFIGLEYMEPKDRR